jgi:hypothetical protein
MPTQYKIYEFQLKDANRGVGIIGSGGAAIVTVAGSPLKATLLDPANNYAALANPIALNYGHGKFAVADTVDSVDIYVMGPEGDFVVVEAVTAGSLTEVVIDMQMRAQVLKLPYHFTDLGTTVTEKDTGLDFPTGAIISPFGLGLFPTAVDATETIDIGMLSTETGGDADGFAALLPLSGTANVANMAGATITAGGTEDFFGATTLGALLRDFTAGANVAGDVGTFNPKHYQVGTNLTRSLSVTPSAGLDTAQGFIFIPYYLFGR